MDDSAKPGASVVTYPLLGFDGDCGSGQIEYAGGGVAPPATLAEFTLNGSGGLYFYHVSLVDGYNLQMLVVPKGGSVGTGIFQDILNGTLDDLQDILGEESRPVGSIGACSSRKTDYGLLDGANGVTEDDDIYSGSYDFE
ncbi:thaumatin-like protein 1 [Papaver somniferum]|uniref:thaumatin-like protein 1 n=1 Tax=Papaver somniferum TaxID=3469 RepID=UPI000E7052F5|nr:thaumatin-like protein 1 [Papaver somniferum]